MRVLVGLFTPSRLVTAFASLWICGTGAAWAGGGASVGSLQAALSGPSGLCSLLGMTSCPALPTVTQLILQFSALGNTPPDVVRSPQGVGLVGGLGICSVAGNQLISGVGVGPCSSVAAINAINPPVLSPSLAQLNPLAFVGPTTGSGHATPVPAETSANSLFYAVATTASGQPDTLSLTYDYPPLTTAAFSKGQQVATISLPLVLLNSNGTEQPVTTTLQISAACTGGTSCLTATAVGNFSGNGTQKRSPGDLGLSWKLAFDTSPSFPNTKHAILSVQAPLVVTSGNDPAYFGVVPVGATTDGTTPSPNVGSATGVNQVSGLTTAFTNSEPGFTTAFLKGVTDGIAPYAAPLTVTGATPTFGFCASFWGGNTTNLNLNPAVAAFLSIGTDGTTYVSSPVQSPGNVGCPF